MAHQTDSPMEIASRTIEHVAIISKQLFMGRTETKPETKNANPLLDTLIPFSRSYLAMTINQ